MWRTDTFQHSPILKNNPSMSYTRVTNQLKKISWKGFGCDAGQQKVNFPSSHPVSLSPLACQLFF